MWLSMVHSVRDSLRVSVYYAGVWDRVGERVAGSVGERVQASVEESIEASVGERVQASVLASVRAYEAAPWLASCQFLAGYLAPNAFHVLHALARFNARVSGYWLSKEAALVVRRPKLLCRDEVGRLHCAGAKPSSIPMAGGSTPGMVCASQNRSSWRRRR